MGRRVFCRVGSVAMVLGLLASCSAGKASDGRVRVVAAFYPLAWAAEEIGGDRVAVEDLTPAGGEAHDLQLTARQRSAIGDAALVLIVGKGFQPEVEKAASDSRGRVIDVLEGLPLLPSKDEELKADPHVWLDPVHLLAIVRRISDALATADPTLDVSTPKALLEQKLSTLQQSFEQGLRVCDLRTMVTTHEAFGYLAARYRFTQLGLTGLTPEAEPSAAQIQRVRELARRGQVAAIFYEATDEGRRIGRSVAADVGVPARPLNTLESDPSPEDYETAMEANLTSLKAGLRCN